MEYAIIDVEDGFRMTAPNGDILADYRESPKYNPAFLLAAYALSLNSEASLWYENQAKYILCGGVLVDEDIANAIDGLLARVAPEGSGSKPG